MPERLSLEDVRRLMEQFNATFEKLQVSYQTLQERYTALQHELEEKNRLLDQKTRLELLGQVSASLAHEVRNPLGGMSLYAEMLRRDLAGEQREIAGKIIRCVDSLNALVTDILTYAGNLDPRPARQPVEPIIDEALELAGERLARVKIDKRYGGIEATFDRGMVQRALLNVILNAADAMNGAGTLTVETTPGSVRISDTGPGISAELLPHLFTPFRTGKARGVGLGLAMARKMIEACGGKIEAANGARGAVFTIKL